MNVCLITIGRLENRYAVEFINYYKQLGFDHIFIADNNHNGEEHFEDVLQSYIDNNFITIYDYRNINAVQNKAYEEIYYNASKDYDWIAFFDFDEFLTLTEDNNIKKYLENFYDTDIIKINWNVYDDNDLIYDDGRPCLERFTRPYKYDNINKINNHVKVIIRSNIDLTFNNPHCPDVDLNKVTICNSDHLYLDNYSPFCEHIGNKAYVKHFAYKTVDEFCKLKIKRGVGSMSDIEYQKLDLIYIFFLINSVNTEKIKIFKKYGFI